MDNPMEAPDDWGQDLKLVVDALKPHDYGRWDWDRIHCCLTGRDADLESWGQQGIEVVSVNEDAVTMAVHAGKSFAGNDVSLNFPSDFDQDDDELWGEILEAWLVQAELTVLGCGSAGEWDGDAWYMSFEEEVKVPWVFAADGVTPDYAATADAMVARVDPMLASWHAEIELADKFMNQLAGWRDADDKPLEEGKPDPELSIFNPIYRNQGD